MEVINLNLIPNGTNPVVHVSQYDEGREFGFNLFNGTNVLTLDGTEDITCVVKKPDGNIVSVAVPNTSSSSVVVTTTLQMTACGGNSVGVLNISKGGVNLYSLNFILYCEKNPLENGIQSDSAIHNLQTQIANAVADQYDSNNVIFDNDPTTGHGIGYTVTSEGIKTAIDNAISGLSIPDELNDLSDVDISGQALGEALVWDGTKWVNGTPELDVGDLDDVTITTPANGDIIVYNNGTWVNVANPASTANFAPDYDDTATYNTNDKVIYNNLLYICLEDNVTGAWDSTKWQQISTADYNASNLPISGNDPTDTKSYIDTGLSGKADTTSFNLHSLTGVGCNVLNGGYVEVGDFIYLSVCVKMTTNHSGDKFISGLPSSIHDGQCVFGMKNADTNNALVSARVYQGGLYVNTNMGNGIEYTFNGVLCK